MATYIAIEPLLLKAGRVEPGDAVVLGERQAKPLLELGAIELHKGKGKGKSSAEEAAEKAEAERKAQEEAEAVKRAEADRLAAEQAEADRKAAEQAAAGNSGAQG